MNPTEAARIACAIAILRPDWDARSLQTFLTDDRNHIARRPYQDAAAALTFVACDPTSKTPARVLEAGPWWKIGQPAPVPPTVVFCRSCRDEHYPGSECTRTAPPTETPHFDDLRRALQESTKHD